MAQQQPAVVMIARHGMRLDAADSSWQHSTPTPYDPPLTYGGWNQCRSLGVRIAGLLHAREEEALNAGGQQNDSIRGRDFAQLDGNKSDLERPKKRRRIKHKVVIHTSPFLRCLQTSVAIASGMAQYNPDGESGRKQQHARLHSPSPGLRAQDGAHGSPKLLPLPDAKHDFAHAIARKALHSHRHRKCKLRVDAFLGEWLNPGYFESITSPPPSSMMVATAKAELMQSENVELFTPTTTTRPTTGTNNLWGGNAEQNKNAGNEGCLDDLNALTDGLPPSPSSPTSPKSPSRSRASTTNDSGRQSPFRPDRTIQPLASILPKQETAIYHPPTPQYAISASSQIPRGYFAHARDACVNVDYSWDSSRPPQDWGDGGELGEEWSSMHKRTRRGFNGMIKWYNSRSADQRNEETHKFDSSGHHSDEEVEEQEDLVVILVTHGAGCNALIGALTGQPVLLDVGMASLTMAVRKDDAPPLTVLASESGPDGTEVANQHHHSGRRGSMDMGLSSVYEMKLVSSSSHMHPAGTGVNSPSMRPQDSAIRHRRPDEGPTARSNTSSALGTIRRPTPSSAAAGWMGSSADRSSSLPPNRLQAPTSGGTSGGTPSTPGLSTGLWTPPTQTSKSPGLSPFMSPAMKPVPESKISAGDREDLALDSSNSDGRSPAGSARGSKKSSQFEGDSDAANNGEMEDAAAAGEDERVAELPKPGDALPPSLTRGLSQKGLWGSQPKGATPERKGRQQPKRRWTVDQD